MQGRSRLLIEYASYVVHGVDVYNYQNDIRNCNWCAISGFTD